jgi:SAM-dependent methyltransferase
MSGPTHGPGLPPSNWLRRWEPLLPAGGSVLDVACGSGRHVRWLAAKGFAVTGVDRDAAALEPLRHIAEVIVADIEEGPWPLAGRRFDAVLVTNYLWRPLLPVLRESLASGGLLLYETFADGQQSVGRPSRADFLLQPGELLNAFAGLRVIAFEDGFLDHPPRFVQRIAAVSAPAEAFGTTSAPPRYALAGAGGPTAAGS